MKDGLLLPCSNDDNLTLTKDRREITTRYEENEENSKVQLAARGRVKIYLSSKKIEIPGDGRDGQSRQSVYPPVLMPPEQEAYLKVHKYDFF